MSELENHVGINYSDVTDEERRAVDRIKGAYYLLPWQRRDTSPTDIIMDLSVAIAAELRRAKGGHKVT